MKNKASVEILIDTKGDVNFQKCSICDEIVNRDMHYYCPVCKTKIDWQE